MITIDEIEPLALALPENDRALLIEVLLQSLPEEFDDEGILEGHRRLDEATLDSSLVMAEEEFISSVRQS